MPANSLETNASTMVPRNTKCRLPSSSGSRMRRGRERGACTTARPAVAAEAVLALDHDGEVQALVEHLRERARRVERQRAQHRLDFPVEIPLEPCGLRFGPAVRRDEHDAVLGQLRHEHIVQDLVLLLDQARSPRADRLQLLGDGQPVRTDLQRARLQQLLQARDPDLEELVEVGAGDAEEPDPFEQGYAAVLRLFQHALIEFQERQFPIDVELRRL